jgi:Ca-activated chloride channel family protein
MGDLVRLTAFGMLTMLLLPAIATGQAGRREVAAGNRLYEEGRYDEAHEQYLEALREAPDSPIAPFNDGNALYRTEELQRAMAAYTQASESEDPVVAAQAWYNLGNTLYRQQQLQPALEAYKEALRRNPADADAKHNLEVTLEQLQQQEQQEQEQQSSDQPPDPDSEGEEEQRAEQDPPGENESDEPQPDEEPPPDEQEQQENENQEQDQSGDQNEDQNAPEDQPASANAAEDQPQPGELSREDAERLLQAVEEDPSQIQRQRRVTAPARPPRRPW